MRFSDNFNFHVSRLDDAEASEALSEVGELGALSTADPVCSLESCDVKRQGPCACPMGGVQRENGAEDVASKTGESFAFKVGDDRDLVES